MCTNPDSSLSVKSYARRLPIKRSYMNGKQNGLSLVELIVGLGLLAVLILGVINFFDFGMNQVSEISARADQVANVSQLGTAIRGQFRHKTRLDPLTGTVTNEGVIFDLGTNPHRFSIRTRARDLTKMSGSSFETVCSPSPSSNPNYQPPPAQYCPISPPVCASGQRHVVQFKLYEDLTGASPTIKSALSFPAAGAKGKDEITAASMCILEANSERIRLKIALSSKGSDNKQLWRYEEVEVWEDMGSMGIEVLQ